MDDKQHSTNTLQSTILDQGATKIMPFFRISHSCICIRLWLDFILECFRSIFFGCCQWLDLLFVFPRPDFARKVLSVFVLLYIPRCVFVCPGVTGSVFLCISQVWRAFGQPKGRMLLPTVAHQQPIQFSAIIHKYKAFEHYHLFKHVCVQKYHNTSCLNASVIQQI